MTFTRRTFVRLSLGSAISRTAERLLAQGVSTHTAKPLPRQAPSGRPFNAHLVDVAQAAGLHAPVIYGGVESKKYILERSEEHTSELQSHSDIVCRLLLEKKKKK